MDAARVKESVQRISGYYLRFEEAKADYEAQVKAELELLSKEMELELLSKEMAGGIKPREAKNIKKAGEALAKDKLKDLRKDAISLADIIEVVESA